MRELREKLRAAKKELIERISSYEQLLHQPGEGIPLSRELVSLLGLQDKCLNPSPQRRGFPHSIGQFDGLDIGGRCTDCPARPAKQVIGSPYTAIPQSHRFFKWVHDSGKWEIDHSSHYVATCKPCLC